MSGEQFILAVILTVVILGVGAIVFLVLRAVGAIPEARHRGTDGAAPGAYYTTGGNRADERDGGEASSSDSGGGGDGGGGGD